MGSDKKVMFVATIVFVAKKSVEKIVEKIIDRKFLAEELSCEEINIYQEEYPEMNIDPGFTMVRVFLPPNESIEEVMASIAKRVI